MTSATVSTARSAGSYAGFWWRGLALLVDFLVVQLLTFFAGVLIGGAIFAFSPAPLEQTNPYPPIWVIWAVNVLLPWLYFALMESSRRQGTVGKRLVGVSVTDLQGERISFVQATGRHFAKLLSVATLLIGLLMAAFTARKQALHDLLAGTLVVGRP